MRIDGNSLCRTKVVTLSSRSVFCCQNGSKKFKILIGTKSNCWKYQKRIAKLMGYDFNIEYKKGLENMAVDALSRLPPVLELGLLSVVNGLNVSVFKE